MLVFMREDGQQGDGLHLLVGTTYIVGSSSKDFPLQKDGKADKSVSRSHATVTVSFERANSQLSIQDKAIVEPFVICKDTSTYGTFVNDGISSKTKLTRNTSATLNSDEKVKFGLQWNIFNLKFEKLIVLTSNATELQSISKCVWTLCGYTLDKWNYDIIPTHLCMNEIKICSQFLCSLCNNLPVTTAAYFVDLEKAIREKQPHPNLKDYLPPIVDADIKKEQLSISDNTKRSRLFKNKTIVFVNSDHWEDYSDVVECAGGVASKWRCCTKTSNYLSSNDDHIVVGAPEDYFTEGDSDKETKKHQARLEDLQKNFGEKKRFVPLSEIGLAILHCCTDKFCNPRFKPAQLIRPVRLSTIKSPEAPREILARDTQDIVPKPTNSKKQKTIMASCEDEDAFNLTESIITFRDQTVTPGSNPRPNKRAAPNIEKPVASKTARIDSLPFSSDNTNFDPPGSSQQTQNMQLDDEDDDDPFHFEPSTALGKKSEEELAQTAAVQEPKEREPVAVRTTQKRARIESSSEEEGDPFADQAPRRPRGGEDSDDDPFGFEETSFKSTVPKRSKAAPKSPIKFFTSTAGPSRMEDNFEESADEDDYNLEEHWLDASSMKTESSAPDSVASEISRRMFNASLQSINSSVRVILPTVPGCQKVFRKTRHECMASIPTIISVTEMKKFNCFTGKPVLKD